jgi:hypothetical protein
LGEPCSFMEPFTKRGFERPWNDEPHNIRKLQLAVVPGVLFRRFCAKPAGTSPLAPSQRR